MNLTWDSKVVGSFVKQATRTDFMHPSDGEQKVCKILCYCLLQTAVCSVSSIVLRDLETFLSLSVTHGCCCHLNIHMPGYMLPCEKEFTSHILMCFTFFPDCSLLHSCGSFGRGIFKKTR